MANSRKIEPGFVVKNLTEDEVLAIKNKYADSVYALFKRMRYGIETCCEFDLDKIDIKNQIADLSQIYDPELCVTTEPECCPAPCSVTTDLFLPDWISCEDGEPIEVQANLTT